MDPIVSYVENITLDELFSTLNELHGVCTEFSSRNCWQFGKTKDRIFVGSICEVHRTNLQKNLVVKVRNLKSDGTKGRELIRVVFTGDVVRELISKIQRVDVLAILNPKYFFVENSCKKILSLTVGPSNVVLWLYRNLKMYRTRENNKVPNEGPNNNNDYEDKNMENVIIFSDNTDTDPNFSLSSSSSSSYFELNNQGRKKRKKRVKNTNKRKLTGNFDRSSVSPSRDVKIYRYAPADIEGINEIISKESTSTSFGRKQISRENTDGSTSSERTEIICKENIVSQNTAVYGSSIGFVSRSFRTISSENTVIHTSVPKDGSHQQHSGDHCKYCCQNQFHLLDLQHGKHNDHIGHCNCQIPAAKRQLHDAGCSSKEETSCVNSSSNLSKVNSCNLKLPCVLQLICSNHADCPLLKSSLWQQLLALFSFPNLNQSFFISENPFHESPSDFCFKCRIINILKNLGCNCGSEAAPEVPHGSTGNEKSKDFPDQASNLEKAKRTEKWVKQIDSNLFIQNRNVNMESFPSHRSKTNSKVNNFGNPSSPVRRGSNDVTSKFEENMQCSESVIEEISFAPTKRVNRKKRKLFYHNDSAVPNEEIEESTPSSSVQPQSLPDEETHPPSARSKKIFSSNSNITEKPSFDVIPESSEEYQPSEAQVTFNLANCSQACNENEPAAIQQIHLDDEKRDGCQIIKKNILHIDSEKLSNDELELVSETALNKQTKKIVALSDRGEQSDQESEKSNETIDLEKIVVRLENQVQNRTPTKPNSKAIVDLSSEESFHDATSHVGSQPSGGDDNWLMKGISEMTDNVKTIEKLTQLNAAKKFPGDLNFKLYKIYAMTGVIINIVPSIDIPLSIVRGTCHSRCQKSYRLSEVFKIVKKQINICLCSTCLYRVHFVCPKCHQDGLIQPLCIFFSFEIHLLVGEMVLRIEVDHKSAVDFVGCNPSVYLRNANAICRKIKNIVSSSPPRSSDSVIYLKAQIKPVHRYGITILTLHETMLKKHLINKNSNYIYCTSK